MLGHTLTNIQIYDNYFHNDSINLRPGIDPQPQELYVYRNRFDQPIFPGGKPLWFCCPPGDGTEISYNYKRYFYHNSFLGHKARGAMGMAGIISPIRTIISIMCGRIRRFLTGTLGGFNPGVALFDYSWTGGAFGTTYIDPQGEWRAYWLAYHSGRWAASLDCTACNSTTPTNFRLPVGHAARNAGIDVTSGAATTLVGRGTPLPGFSPGYFTGSAPHMGAIQDRRDEYPSRPTGCYPQNTLSVLFVDSQYPPDPVTKAIDNNILTHWATDYGR